MPLVRSEHELELAKELLDDIELSRVKVDALILKASRLARLCGTEEFQKWLDYEVRGYNSSTELSLAYMGKTGRWINREKQEGYWMPVAQVDSLIAAKTIELESMTTPNVSGTDYANVVMHNYLNNKSATSSKIAKLTGIKSRVLGILHTFTAEIYYEKELDYLAESIFENYKNDVDTLISSLCGDVLQQIPSVVNRLAEGEEESVSQALTTVRRIIDNFADAIFPATDETYNIGGNSLTLDSSKHLNRLNVFVHQRVESRSRRDKIRQNLSNLYGRVSTGVHADVSIEEAQSLFLNCYLLLGEILHISKMDKIVNDQ